MHSSSADVLARARSLRAVSQVLRDKAALLRAAPFPVILAALSRTPSELDEVGALLREFEGLLVDLENQALTRRPNAAVDDLASAGLAMLNGIDEVLDACMSKDPDRMLHACSRRPPPLLETRARKRARRRGLRNPAHKVAIPL